MTTKIVVREGYGTMCPVDITTKEKLVSFCKNHHILNRLADEISNDEFGLDPVFDYVDLDGGRYGIASMISDVVWSEQKVSLLACDDYDGDQYLMFLPYYPWAAESKTPEELAIATKRDVDDIILPYLDELYGEGVMILDYVEAENVY